MKAQAEKIRKAADYIETVGLHKGQAFEGPADSDPSGVLTYKANLERREKCCTWGGLQSHGVHYSQVEAFARSVGLHGEQEIWGWNDAEVRTQDEVVAALRAFAQKLEDDSE